MHGAETEHNLSVPQGIKRELRPYLKTCLEMGTSFGGFALEEIVGKGARGAVFRARNDEGQIAAIKLINEPHDRMDRARFELEARALERLAPAKSPHILTYISSGIERINLLPDTRDRGDKRSWDYEIPFIATEFIKGKAFSDVLRAGLHFRDVVQYCRAIVSALHVVHAHGLIHKDVKPSNVLINREDSATLADFGLVRFISGDHANATKVQRLHLEGTPYFMAPEQFDDEADHRVDVYAVGMILYRELARSFDMHSLGDTDTLDLAKRGILPALRDEFLESSRFDGTPQKKYLKQFKEQLRTLVAPDPEQRFQTAREAGAALDEMVQLIPPETNRAVTKVKGGKTQLTFFPEAMIADRHMSTMEWLTKYQAILGQGLFVPVVVYHQLMGYQAASEEECGDIVPVSFPRDIPPVRGVGRHPDNVFHLHDVGDGVSRFHAIVYRRGRQVMLRDKNPKNGLFVGEYEVRGEPYALKTGDIIDFGRSMAQIDGQALAQRAWLEVRAPLLDAIREAWK